MTNLLKLLVSLLGILSIIFLMCNLENIDKDYTYIQELQFKLENIEQSNEDHIEKYNELLIKFNKQEKELQQKKEALEWTNEECLRLRRLRK